MTQLKPRSEGPQLRPSAINGEWLFPDRFQNLQEQMVLLYVGLIPLLCVVVTQEARLGLILCGLWLTLKCSPISPLREAYNLVVRGGDSTP